MLQCDYNHSCMIKYANATPYKIEINLEGSKSDGEALHHMGVMTAVAMGANASLSKAPHAPHGRAAKVQQYGQGR